ncbi:MAG TPA: LysR family transcriptional regulator [Nannocystis sp.]
MAAPIDLNLVRAFVGVHETGSFSAAAQRLGVPRSTVSRAVATLEQATGTLLFHRTTRSVTTTPAGIALFDRVAPSLAALDASLAELPETIEAPRGTLRLTTSADLGMTLLAEAVARFTARHPEVRVEVHLGRAIVDLVRERFDLALRFSPGPLRDSSLVARRLGPVVFALYAAPQYLARRGAPRSLTDLHAHESVGLGGAPDSPLPDPRTTCDDKFFAREVLRAGAGIGLLPTYLADADLASGALVRVLPRWELRRGAVYLVQPGRKHVPARVTAFRELLLEVMRQRPLAAG